MRNRMYDLPVPFQRDGDQTGGGSVHADPDEDLRVDDLAYDQSGQSGQVDVHHGHRVAQDQCQASEQIEGRLVQDQGIPRLLLLRRYQYIKEHAVRQCTNHPDADDRDLEVPVVRESWG